METSTFGSDFIALRTTIELNDGLHYKLRILGVPVKVPSSVIGNNKYVFINGSFPELTLKKKHCSIAFHRVKESVTVNKILIYFERTGSNIADLSTKIITANKRHP